MLNRNHPSIMTSHLHSKEWCTTSIWGKYRSSCCYFLGVQRVNSLLVLPQCSAGCSLGLCSCLRLCSTICFNGRVWDLAVLSSDQRSCWCNCASLPVPACCASSQAWAERSTGSPRAGSASQGGNLWDWPVLWSSCLRDCPAPGPRTAKTFCWQYPCAITAIFCVCWLLYPMPISKVLQPENFQSQQTKLSMKIKIMEITVGIIKAVQSQTGAWDSVNNKPQAPQISSRLFCALQCELKMRGLWVPLCSRWPNSLFPNIQSLKINKRTPIVSAHPVPRELQ